MCIRDRASTDAITWTTAGTGASFSIPHNLEGHQLQARIEYTDGQGFKETITTATVSVPGTTDSNPNDQDDYGNDTDTNGRLTVNSSISGELESAGDRDWFAIDLTAGRRYQFDLDGLSLDDPFLYLRSNSSSLLDYNDDESCLLYTSPSPRDVEESRMPSSA